MKKILLIILMLSFSNIAFAKRHAAVNTHPDANLEIKAAALNSKDPVEERAVKEKIVPKNAFAITFYKPTYILPYYYTGSPYQSVYTGQTPHGEKIQNNEFKYQLSFKVPLWDHFLRQNTSINFGYTQLSYWQIYNKYKFFRETDYEPEIFISNEINYSLINNLKLTFLNIGLDHQSNGFGNNLERSWNRAYLAATFSASHFMLTAQPWYVFKDSSIDQNKDISDYLGHGKLILSYKFNDQVLSLTTYNMENSIHRTSADLTYSFPMTPYIKGFVQAFTGYGQSMIEYKHHTNSIGFGIALSDWV